MFPDRNRQPGPGFQPPNGRRMQQPPIPFRQPPQIPNALSADAAADGTKQTAGTSRASRFPGSFHHTAAAGNAASKERRAIVKDTR